MEIIGKIAVFVCLIFVRAITVMLGWQWFVAPLGVQEIGMAHALGMSTFVAILTQNLSDRDDEKKGEDSGNLAYGLGVNLVALGLMWIFQLFM